MVSRSRRQRALGALGLAMATVVAAGCTGRSGPPPTVEARAEIDSAPGSSSTGPSATTAGAATSTVTGPTGTSAASQDRAADAKKAEAALLTVDDLPGADWKAKQQISDEEDPGFTSDCGSFTRKVKDAKALFDAAPHARSPRFSPGQGVELNEMVSVLASVDEADRIMAVYSDRAMPDCVATIVQDQIAQGDAKDVTFVGAPEVAPLDLETTADDTAGFLVTAQVEKAGQQFTVWIVYCELQVGRALAELQLSTLVNPTVNDARTLAKPAVRRLAEQFAAG